MDFSFLDFDLLQSIVYLDINEGSNVFAASPALQSVLLFAIAGLLGQGHGNYFTLGANKVI